MRSQAHVEYLMMVGIGVLLSLVAAAGVFLVASTIKSELETAYSMKDTIVEGLR